MMETGLVTKLFHANLSSDAGNVALIDPHLICFLNLALRFWNQTCMLIKFLHVYQCCFTNTCTLASAKLIFRATLSLTRTSGYWVSWNIASSSFNWSCVNVVLFRLCRQLKNIHKLKWFQNNLLVVFEEEVLNFQSMNWSRLVDCTSLGPWLLNGLCSESWWQENEDKDGYVQNIYTRALPTWSIIESTIGTMGSPVALLARSSNF